ncbi:MAG: outer membrane beta-barrel protein [Bacteroidales bacterium]|nr:outer membrane beta-barrel protein [Bacteroidales bacterium]
MKRFLGLLLLTTVSISSLAQHSLQGKVLDKNNEGGIEMATVRLLNTKDSTLVQGCLTDEKGSFLLSKVKNGNFMIEVRFLGYHKFYRNIAMADKNILLKNIYLEADNQYLKEVEIKGMTAQMAVKGDTIEYNSSAFKTAENAVVEELLKKLPGVVVDAEGKITVNGEEIKKVRVDGKKFFGDDVQMATKNLPVDMIDKVQVVDQKSEMAQLTGFEDDNTERIINLTTKANRKNRLFGNATAGGGADIDGNFRYNTNANLNIWQTKAQTSIIGGANNTNTIRSSRGRGGMSGGGNNGITETQNFGVNNNTELSKKLKVGGDGTYNHSINTSETSSERENWLDGIPNSSNNQSRSVRENNQANMRLELEWNPDTLTTLIVQPNISYNKSISSGNNQYENFNAGDSISWGNSSNTSESHGLDAGLNLILNRKSKAKKGRTLTINAGGSFSDSDSEGFNKSEKITYTSSTNIDQQTTNTSQSYNANLRISYVEPLWNLKNFLQTSANVRVSSRKSDKLQYKNDGNGDYNVLDSVYSNNFENNFYNESLEMNFRHQETNYNYMLGIKAEPSQTYSTSYYKNGYVLDRRNEVINYSPSAQFRYNFGRKKFARLEYRGRTNQPSIEQMQPVKNNNNQMNETMGNSSLNPSFEQSLRLMYSSYNAERYSSFSAGLNGSYTKDALVSNSIYNLTGKEYRQTLNAEKAPFKGSAGIMFNTPIIKNRLQFSTRSDIGYEQRFGYSKRSEFPFIQGDSTLLIKGDLNKTQIKNAGESLSLTFTTDVIEIGARGSVRYTRTQNNLNENKIQETTDWTGSGNVNLHLPNSFTISNDISYTTRQGYSSFDKNELVWNASIDKSLFRKQGTISLKMYDILHQKLNVRESIGDNNRQLSRFNALTSYAMLSFTYRLSKSVGGATAGGMMRGRQGGYGRGEGGSGFPDRSGGPEGF